MFRNTSFRKITGSLLAFLFVVSVFVPLYSVSGAPILSQKWVTTGLARGFSGVLTANLDSDAYEEIVMGGDDYVICLDGNTGVEQWRYTNTAIGFFCQIQMADVDSDGVFEVIVPLEFPPGIALLDGSNGIELWIVYLTGNGREGSVTSSPVVGDINGNGYSTIFVGREDVDSTNGYNGGIVALSWNGQILAETWAYRPCSGGLSLADVDGNGVFELFMGDRSSPGDGVRSLNAHTLEPLWESNIQSSSFCPVLADVTGDGVLDVVAENLRNTIYVLNSLTGEIIREENVDAPAHYQPVVHDIDRDGNLEIILADGDHSNTPSYILIWDLVDWKEDARLDPGLCVYPPQLGDVTGDGFMDIIACTYTGVFIYSYNSVSKDFDLVDQITDLAGWLTYAVVQDVDNDGLNEIIVQSMGRRIYCFDTIAARPSLRARSEVQFYSERRLGASEYVPPPGVVGPTEYSLDVNITPEGSGSVVKTPNKQFYHGGEVVTLSAVSAPGWKFNGWSGDLSGNTNPIVITMTENKVVTANFVEFTYLFEDGFESGDTNEWSGVSGLPAVQTAVKHDGFYAMEAAASGRTCYLSVSESTVHVRGYFYVDSADGTVQVMRLRAGSSTIASVIRTASGALQLAYRSGSSVLYDTSVTTLSLDAWHCIELRVVVGGLGEYTVWVDGVEIGDVAHSGVDNAGYGVISRVDVGCVYSSSSTVDVYVDSVVASNDYIGT